MIKNSKSLPRANASVFWIWILNFVVVSSFGFRITNFPWSDRAARKSVEASRHGITLFFRELVGRDLSLSAVAEARRGRLGEPSLP